MPELPEVETVKRGLEPWLLNRTITGAEVRIERLRLPIPEEIHQLNGQTIHKVHRRPNTY
jgi:formamidopyrimidine-DNA glycosylase